MLLAGVVALGIQLAVKVPSGDAGVFAGLQIDDHAAAALLVQLADARDRQGDAGVGAGAADLAGKAAVAPLVQARRPAEQDGHGVVEDHDALAGDAAALQLRNKGGADQLAFAAGHHDLLVDHVHARVHIRRDRGGIGEAEADHVRPVHQRCDAVGGKADEFLPGAGGVRAGHLALGEI